MIAFLDLDNPQFDRAVTLGSLKKTELSFSTSTSGVSDLLVVTETPIPIVNIPAASSEIKYPIRTKAETLFFRSSSLIDDKIAVSENNLSGSIPPAPTSIDTSKRKIYDGINFSTVVESDIVTLIDEPLIGSLGGGCMGFCTNLVSTRGWFKEKVFSKTEELNFLTAEYNDKMSVTENALPNPSISAAMLTPKKVINTLYDCLFFFTRSGTGYNDTVVVTPPGLSVASASPPNVIKNKYFDAAMWFSAESTLNLKSVVSVVDENFEVVPVGNLSNCRNVPLGGVVKGLNDYTLIVLNNENNILFKGDLVPGAWTKEVVTGDNTVTVVGIAKVAGKKSFAYKSIDISDL